MILESLCDSSFFFLAALAFAMVFTSTRDGLFHLAQGGLAIFATCVFNRVVFAGLGVPSAIAVGVATGGLLGLAVELGVYRQLRRFGARSEVFLLASFGLLIVFERLAVIWLGTEPLYLPSHTKLAARFSLLGTKLTASDVTSFLVSLIVLLVSITLYSGRLGRRLVAVRESPLMYDWRGGRSSIVFAVISILSGSIAGAAMILEHVQHRVVITDVAIAHLLPAFVVVLLALAVNGRIALLVPLKYRFPSLERASLLCLTWIISFVLAVVGRVVVLFGEPRWRDTAFLLLAIACLVLLTGKRVSLGEEAASA